MQNKKIWREFYTQAAALNKMAPWTFMQETEIFAIKNTRTGTRYFISIMGSAGEYPAMAAYEEVKGITRFWDLYNENEADSSDMLTIPHLILSFDTLEYADQEQISFVKELGFDKEFGASWPVFKRIIPAWVPALPEKELVADFTELIQQALVVCARAAKEPDFIHSEAQDDDTYLFAEPPKEIGKKWQYKYRKVTLKKDEYKIAINNEMIEILKALPESRVVLQAHYQITPFPMKDENSPAVFPFLTFMVDKKTGRIEAHEILQPLPDFDEMIANMPLIFTNFILNLGFRPRCIEVKNPLLFDMLTKILLPGGIRMVLSKTLATADEAFEGFLRYMSGPQE